MAYRSSNDSRIPQIFKIAEELKTQVERIDDPLNFQERVNDSVANLLKEGSNVTLTYDDTNDSLKIDVNSNSINHNLLNGLQGGASDEYYHLTTSAHNKLVTGINADSLHFHNTNNIQEGNNLFFTDQRAQDAVASILEDSNTIDFIYQDNNASPAVLQAFVKQSELVIENQSTDFTTGSIPFSADGRLAEDNSNLFWDLGNNRLGIGTSSPNAKLDVQGGNINLNSSHALQFDQTDILRVNLSQGSIAVGDTSAPQYDGHFVLQQANLNSNPLIQGDFNTGDIGIGLSNGANLPAKLNISGNTYGQSVLKVTGTEGTLLDVTDNLSSGSIFQIKNNINTSILSVEANEQVNIKNRLNVSGNTYAQSVLKVTGTEGTLLDVTDNLSSGSIFQLFNKSGTNIFDVTANEIVNINQVLKIKHKAGIGKSNSTTLHSNLEVEGSVAKSITTITSDITLDDTYYTVKVDASNNDVKVTLPPTSNRRGRIYNILRIDNTSNQVFIIPYGSSSGSPNNSDVIIGESQIEISAQWDIYSLQTEADGLWVFI
jgi:hypothetical protein